MARARRSATIASPSAASTCRAAGSARIRRRSIGSISSPTIPTRGRSPICSKVVRYAQQRVDAPTFLVGHSRGGGVALLGARRIENLSGIVTWSAIARTDRWDDATKRSGARNGYLDVGEHAHETDDADVDARCSTTIEANRDRLDILSCVTQIEHPMLVIHGGRDEACRSAESREIASYARRCVARRHRQRQPHLQRHPSAGARAVRADHGRRGDRAFHQRVRVAS